MNKQSVVLETLKAQPNNAGLNDAQILLAQAQAEDMKKQTDEIKKMDNRMNQIEIKFDSIDQKVDSMNDKVDSISYQMSLVLKQLESLDKVRANANFLLSIIKSRLFFIIFSSILFLIIGNNAKSILSFFGV